MKKIHKYAMGDRHVKIMMSTDSIIRHVGMQNNVPCLWVEETPDGIQVERTFRAYGDGEDILTEDSSRQYIGTFFAEGGLLVWHVYEEFTHVLSA